MKKTLALSERDRRILELLARGAPASEVARAMGYTYGSTRVYLHRLYQKIGVKDKQTAVVWFHDRLALSPNASSRATTTRWPPREESFGDMALRTNLFSALGAMGTYLGPYGRLWETSIRLKGKSLLPAEDALRGLARVQWEAFLREDAEPAREIGSKSALNGLLRKSPSTAVVVALSFLIGGYSRDAAEIMERLSVRRRIRHAVSASELSLISTFQNALVSCTDEAIEDLRTLADRTPPNTPVRHTALATLFYAYRAIRDIDHARSVANGLWSEAEGIQRQLREMGDRPLGDVDAHPVAPQSATTNKRTTRGRSEFGVPSTS